MARLGRRERLEKRKRLEALAALKLARQAEAKGECESQRLYRDFVAACAPKNWEGKGRRSISPDHLKEHCHTQSLRVGSNLERHSMPYKGGVKWSKALPSGSSLNFASNQAKKRKAQKPRFAPAFMAPGYEYLASNEPGRGTVEILVPPETRFRKA